VVDYCEAGRLKKLDGNPGVLTSSREMMNEPVILEDVGASIAIMENSTTNQSSSIVTENDADLSIRLALDPGVKFSGKRKGSSMPNVRTSRGDTVSDFEAKARIASGILSSDNITINESKDYRLETNSDNLVTLQGSGGKPDQSGLLGSIPTSDPSRPQSLLELSGVSSRPDTLTRPMESIIITGPLSEPNNNRGQTSTVGNQILHNSGRQESATTITSVTLALHNQNVEKTKVNQQLGFTAAPDLTKDGAEKTKAFPEVKFSNNPIPTLNQFNFPASALLPIPQPKEQTFLILTMDFLWESLQRMVSNVADFQTPGIMAVLVEINRDSNKFIKDSVYCFYDRHPTLRDNWEKVLMHLGINEDDMADQQKLYLSLQFLRNQKGEPAEAFFVFAVEFIRQKSQTGAITSVKSKVSQAYKDFVKEYYNSDLRADIDDYVSFHTPSDLISLVTKGVIKLDFKSVTILAEVPPPVQQNFVPLEERVVAEKMVLTSTGPQRMSLQKFFPTSPILKRDEVELKAPKKSNVAHLSD
jgi:hypothetical protein